MIIRMKTKFSGRVSIKEERADVYSLDMFYGDQTLQNLVDHARSLDKQLETFEYIYSLTEEAAIETEEENGEELDDDSEEIATA